MEILYIQMLEHFPSFEIYIAIQTFLWFGLIWWFYTRYTEKSYLWLALFFLFFNVAGISTNITALRTNVVSILLIPGFYFLMRNTKRDKLCFAGLVILSSFFHKSSIALLPLVLLNAKRGWILKDKKILLLVIIGIGVVSVVFKNVLTIFLANTLIESMPDFFESYSSYLEDYENIKLSGLSTIIYLAQLFVLLNGLTEETDGKHVVLIKVGVIFVLAELFVVAYLLSRYAAILYPAFIVGFIRSLKYIQKQYAVYVVVLVMLLSGFNFYQTRTSRSSISTAIYHSILDK